jgi:hypothetical protein
MGKIISLWIFICLPAGSLLAEEGEIKVGGAALFGSEFSSALNQGIGGEIFVDKGTNEFINLTARMAWVQHALGDGQPYGIFDFSAGMSLNLDALFLGVATTFVPQVGLRLSYLRHMTDQNSSGGLGLSLGLGFDYLVRESFFWGLSVEYHGLLSDLDRLPVYFTAGVRLGWRQLDW